MGNNSYYKSISSIKKLTLVFVYDFFFRLETNTKIQYVRALLSHKNHGGNYGVVENATTKYHYRNNVC